jgi:hypothetical protein
MSAVLARPGSGEIVLASQATTAVVVTGDERPALDRAYADAARRAVDNLRQAASAWRPDATRTMVTGVVLGGTTAPPSSSIRRNGDGGERAKRNRPRCRPIAREI